MRWSPTIRRRWGRAPVRRFTCRGRDCGRSNGWANQVFGQAILYGPEANQFYIAADQDGELVSAYVIERGNRRIYAHVEALRPRSWWWRLTATLVEDLAGKGFVALEQVRPRRDGSIPQAGLAALDAVAPRLRTFERLTLYVVLPSLWAGGCGRPVDQLRGLRPDGPGAAAGGLDGAAAPELVPFGAVRCCPGPTAPRPALNWCCRTGSTATNSPLKRPFGAVLRPRRRRVSVGCSGLALPSVTLAARSGRATKHMSGNTFGQMFTVTTFGESHGPALGAVVDGCPPGLALSEQDIQPDLDRRRPGRSKFTTQRRERDRVKILSGVFEGQTTGTPIGLLVENEDQKSKDYEDLKQLFRPAHADYTYHHKYGVRDHRGSGLRFGPGDGDAGWRPCAIAKKGLLELAGVRCVATSPPLAHIRPRFESWAAVEDNPFFCPEPSRVEAIARPHRQPAPGWGLHRRGNHGGSPAVRRSAWVSRCSPSWTGSWPAL